ncbi:hypothetical protein MMC10_005900 [Thelotrema lepadinum]|nr:hypothetical protein [Thelotrema lepadinum]
MLLFTSLLLFLLPLALSADNPTRQTIAYIPLPYPLASPPSPIPLGVLTYDASNSTYTLDSYTAPKQSKPASTSSQALARIGLLSSSKTSFTGRSSTLSLLSTLSSPESATVRVSLEAEGSILSVGISPAAAAEAEGLDSRTERKGGLPNLEIVPAAPEPKAVLNKPVFLNREGKVVKEEGEGEKTLLQRYWWVLAGVLLVTMVGGGGGGEEGGGERK